MKFKVGTKEYDIKDEDVTKAVTEGTAITLVEDAIVRSKAEDDAFVENQKKDARKEGEQIAVKNVREEMGLKFEGKTVKNLVEAVKAHAIEEAGLEPGEQVAKIKTKLTEKETALKTALTERAAAEGKIKELQSTYKIDKLLDSVIPANTALPAEDIKIILKSKMSFKENEEGILEVYDTNGQVMKNPTTADALPMKEAVENFFRDNTHYMKPITGGGGGGDSSKNDNGKMSIDKFNEAQKEKGNSINSPMYTQELNKAIADKILDLE